MSSKRHATDDGGMEVDRGSIIAGVGLAVYSPLTQYLGSYPGLGELSILSLDTAESVLLVLYGGSVASAGWLEAQSKYFGWLDDLASLVGILMLGLHVLGRAADVNVPDLTVFLAAATVFLAVPSAAAKYLTRGGRSGGN
nr:MAG: hypothetical protein J07AB56_06350 [Candidatus Nanosalinarum sp. J07AB56]